MKTGDRVLIFYRKKPIGKGTIEGRIDDDSFYVLLDGWSPSVRMFADELTLLTPLHEFLEGEDDA